MLGEYAWVFEYKCYSWIFSDMMPFLADHETSFVGCQIDTEESTRLFL